MNLFYATDIDGMILPAEIILSEEESYHCIRVMRMSIQDPISITDGKGNIYQAAITDGHPKKCRVTILRQEKHIPGRPYKVHLAVAPTKNIERFEWFLEKATEIGIDEITPLLCEHSERTTLRKERLEKILVSAMKQSQNLYLPVLNEMCRFNDFVKQQKAEQKFIAYVTERQDSLLKNCYRPGNDCTILVGPEGDFSRTEVENALKNGYTIVSLGNSRLRTETAAIVATHTIKLLNL